MVLSFWGAKVRFVVISGGACLFLKVLNDPVNYTRRQEGAKTSTPAISLKCTRCSTIGPRGTLGRSKGATVLSKTAALSEPGHRDPGLLEHGENILHVQVQGCDRLDLCGRHGVLDQYDLCADLLHHGGIEPAAGCARTLWRTLSNGCAFNLLQRLP